MAGFVKNISSETLNKIDNIVNTMETLYDFDKPLDKSKIGRAIYDKNCASSEARIRALTRTLLVAKLCTSRCTTAEELEHRFGQLFALALEKGFVPNVEMLGVASGISTRTLLDIESDVTHKDSEMSRVIRNAKLFIASMDADLASENEMNANVYKFRASNFYGLREKQEVVVTPNMQLDEPSNAERIMNAIPQLED